MTNNEELKMLGESAIEWLKQLISIKSYSGQEHETAAYISGILEGQGFTPHRLKNNIWAAAGEMDPQKPTLLLNSHHDTVQSHGGWTRDPFTAKVENGKLYGLGSNDAGGPLVSLLAVFKYLSTKPQAYNLLFLASAEEETSGKNGVPVVLPELGNVDLGVVGEPTSMDLAIAERGLIVLDCLVSGESGHAARNEGDNAIYKALKDIEWFRNYRFQQESDLLGSVNMTVTQIEAGRQHNVVPEECRFVVDVRPNEYYSNQEVVDLIRSHTDCEVSPRSTHLNASGIDETHEIVSRAKELGIRTYGSLTMSDQVHMPFNSVKIGPGNTRRSHTADEFIFIEEIKEGILRYAELLDGLKFDKSSIQKNES